MKICWIVGEGLEVTELSHPSVNFSKFLVDSKMAASCTTGSKIVTGLTANQMYRLTATPKQTASSECRMLCSKFRYQTYLPSWIFYV